MTVSVFLVADSDVRIMIELAIPSQLVLMALGILATVNASICIQDIATASLGID